MSLILYFHITYMLSELETYKQRTFKTYSSLFKKTFTIFEKGKSNIK